MATINFKTAVLDDYYRGAPAGAVNALLVFRETGGNLTEAQKKEIAALDNRIAAFQNAITANPPKAGSEESPYDKEYLKREFMEEVFAALLARVNRTNQRSAYSEEIVYTGDPSLPVPTTDSGATFKTSTEPNLLKATVSLFADYYDHTANGPVPLTNFSDLTLAQMKSVVNNDGDKVLQAYSEWIDKVFEEGNTMKENPEALVSLVSAVSERTHGGIVYDRVKSVNTLTKNAAGEEIFKYYLLPKDAPKAQIAKVDVIGTAFVKDSLTTKQVAETLVVPSPETPPRLTEYLEVDKDLNPVINGIGIKELSSNLTTPLYLYYFNEARVRILRGQLMYKDLIAQEIRDDLAKANAAYADLEAKAGLTRPQSDAGVPNPDTSSETSTIDFFEATNSIAGKQLFDVAGDDDLHDYTQWGYNRSTLKTYIDRKSTQSQDAMLDYQTTLNRYNNAYEVMSKIQEKMDGLLKSQLRNI